MGPALEFFSWNFFGNPKPESGDMELAPDFSHAASGPLSRQRRRPRGRPKALSFQRKIEIAQAWGEALNAHAVFERDRKRDRAVAKLQARFRTLCAAHAPPHKLAEVTAAIDKLGRITRVPIKPPAMILPIIDRALAQFFGITPRMVRRCRGDSRLRPFMPHPVWLERDWVRAVRLEFEARQVAKRLMTPERFAKQEPVRFVNGGLQVPFKVGIEWEIILGAAPIGARCSFFEPSTRMSTDREARAQRATRAFAERVAAWKRWGNFGQRSPTSSKCGNV
jgi:hypothetical protein